MDEIAERKMAPRPRWRFTAVNGLLWSGIALTVFVGGAAVATSAFLLSDFDWDTFRYLDRGFFTHAFIALPYLWLAILLSLVVVSLVVLRHTKKGYRYGTGVAIGATFGAFVMLGVVLFTGGFRSTLHTFLSERVPLYNSLTYTGEDVWVHPERGLLGGTVTAVNRDDQFSLRDLEGASWRVETRENLINEGEEAPFPGTRVKLIGKTLGDHVFNAVIIRPWGY